jgi:hypothetical protein
VESYYWLADNLMGEHASDGQSKHICSLSGYRAN